MMNPRAFTPGFRLSTLDVLVLVIGTAVATALATVTWWWGFVVGFVLAHFFLFCNVLRLRRSLELVWAGVFVATVACFSLAGRLDWLIVAEAIAPPLQA